MWRCLIDENMLVLLKLLAQRFISEDIFKGTVSMVIAAVNAVNFQYIVQHCPRDVSFLTHYF